MSNPSKKTVKKYMKLFSSDLMVKNGRNMRRFLFIIGSKKLEALNNG